MRHGQRVEDLLDAVEHIVVQVVRVPLAGDPHLLVGQVVAGVGDEQGALTCPAGADIQARHVLGRPEGGDVDGAGLALDLVGGAGVPVVEVPQQRPRGERPLPVVVEPYPDPVASVSAVYGRCHGWFGQWVRFGGCFVSSGGRTGHT